MVEPGPDVKDVITTSSSEIVNASIAPAKIPGAASGSTIRRNACTGVAPRSAAASTSRLSNCDKARFHDDDDERDAERDVRGDHGSDAQLDVREAAEERGEGDAHDDLGHDQGDEDQRRVDGTAAELETGQRERGERADDRRDESSR